MWAAKGVKPQIQAYAPAVKHSATCLLSSCSTPHILWSVMSTLTLRNPTSKNSAVKEAYRQFKYLDHKDHNEVHCMLMAHAVMHMK